MFEARFAEDGTVLAPRVSPPADDGHKYDRGHAFVLSGPRHATGAARLAAMACLRVGAGLVTVVGEAAALDEHAAHLTAIMLRRDDGANAFIDDRTGALALGPGLGVGEGTRAKALDWLGRGFATVLDADALTSFAEDSASLFSHLREDVVLTPHAGEFARLFPDIEMDDRASAVRSAAERSEATVLLKGAATHIASPSGRHAVNRHATPWLATAAAGDVLTGTIAGLLSQHDDAFEAAAMAAWLHGDAGQRGGAGLIADDLPGLLALTLADLCEERA